MRQTFIQKYIYEIHVVHSKIQKLYYFDKKSIIEVININIAKREMFWPNFDQTCYA